MGKFQKKSTQYTENTKGLIRTAFTMYGFLGDRTIIPMKYTVCFYIDKASGAVSLRDTVKGESVPVSMFEFFCNKSRANAPAERIAREGNRASGGPKLVMGDASGYCTRSVEGGAEVWSFATPRYTAAEVIDILVESSDKDFKGYNGVRETVEQKVARGELCKEWLATNS